jgi:hypothetical protein
MVSSPWPVDARASERHRGQTVTIPVTITPSAAPGTVVSGNLYVDELESNVPPPSPGVD